MANKGKPQYKTITNYFEAFDWFKDKAHRIIRDITGERKREMTARAMAFTKLNEDSLVVIMDTKSDTISIAYKEDYMTSDIQSPKLKLNQKLLRKVIERQFTDEKKMKEALTEFMEITHTLFLNFFRIINDKKQKVAEEKELNKKQKLEDEEKTPEQAQEETPETPAEESAE